MKVLTMLPLGEQENRLDRFLETIPAIIWSADPETLEFTDVSRAAESILGYPRERWMEPGFWMDHLHPADTGVRKHARRRRLLRWSDEHRIQKRDGTWAWVLARGRALADATGKPSRIIGSLVDITSLSLFDGRLIRLHHRLTLEALA